MSFVKRQESHRSETKDFITHNKSSSQNMSVFCLCVSCIGHRSPNYHIVTHKCRWHLHMAGLHLQRSETCHSKISLWHVHYFELKTIEAGKTQEEILTFHLTTLAFLVAQMVKNPPVMEETQIWSLGREDPLEKGLVTHFSILAWRIPWTEEPGRLQSVGLQRAGHDWVTNTHTHIYNLIYKNIYNLFFIVE